MRQLVALLSAALIAGAPTRGVAQASALPQQAPAFAIPQSGLSFETGDTWSQNGQRMRLYGVQACLRGTSFTNAAGVKTDCGEASLAYLAAVIRDTAPSCVPIAQLGGAIVVVCSAKVGGATLDLGTILVTQGFAFASFSADGKPVYMPYLVAEIEAKKRRAGLWAAADMPHPNSIIFSALKAQKP